MYCWFLCNEKKIHYGSKLGGQGIKDNYINNSINFAITRNFYISIWKGKKKKTLSVCLVQIPMSTFEISLL